MSISKTPIFIGKVLRTMITFPLSFIGLILGVPNVKIVYKSGHVEYYFFENWGVDREGSNITSVTWKTAGAKRPFHLGLENIESIVQLW
jgi:hypothetical protein